MRLHATRLASISYGRGLGNLLWDLAGARPSLDQRFAESRSLIDAVSGQQLITYARVGDGKFVGSNGLIQTAGTNVPRFDHDPLTLESLGLLVEEQRTNLLLRSEEFDNASWTKFRSNTTANSTTAPNGALVAKKLTEDSTASNTHGLFQSAAITSLVQYTYTVYAKAAERSWILLGLNIGAGEVKTWFNLSTGTVGDNFNTSASIISVGNGWYRCSVTNTSSGTTATSVIKLATQNGVEIYTGDGSSGVSLWGAQLEAGAFATSYILTTTATVTRSASVADVINQAIANNIRTLYLEFRSPASGTRGVVSLNDNTANERAAVITSGTDPRLVVYDGGVEQANINGGTITANTRTRVAVRINQNDFAISINGGAVVTDTSGTLPTVDRLMLGRTQAGEYLNAPLARVIGWREALPNSTLQTLAG